MKINLTLFTLFFIGIFAIQAQTIISQNIDFSDESQTHVLHTHNNDQFIGQIAGIHNDTIAFKMRTIGNIIHFPISNVRFIGLTGENIHTVHRKMNIVTRRTKRSPLPMPNNQLMYTATALPYRSKGTYRNTMLFINQVEKQVTDHFNFSVGSLVPVHISIKLQGKISFNELVHASLVVQEHIILFAPIYATHPYGILTIGEHEKYINLAFGYWMHYAPASFFGSEEKFNYPTFSLGGSYTFGNGWRFYTETMIIIDELDRYLFPSFTFSHYKGRNMFEFGVAALPEFNIPMLPLLSYYRAL